MSDDFQVHVVAYGDGRPLQLQWRDPVTNKRRTKSAGTSDRKKAEKAAGKLEAELREGRYSAPLKTAWTAFRERYEREVLILQR